LIKRFTIGLVLLAFATLFSSFAHANGTLSDNIRIKSDILGYDLQYRVYVPETVNPNDKLPRRNDQFFCKKDYVDFFTTELVPFIDQTYHTSSDRNDRVILGVSFGGFNAGCFGLMATPYFGNIAMNSPAHSQFVTFLKKQYKNFDKKNLKIYLSVGNQQDNRLAVRSLRLTLKKKGYDLTYTQNDHGHNWNNWKPLLPEILETFFAVEKDD